MVSLCEGCAATDIRPLYKITFGLLLIFSPFWEQLTDFVCDFWSIHVGHAVVEHYDFKHAICLSLSDLLESLLDDLQAFWAISDLLSSDASFFEHLTQVVNVHGLVIYDKDLR